MCSFQQSAAVLCYPKQASSALRSAPPDVSGNILSLYLVYMDTSLSGGEGACNVPSSCNTLSGPSGTRCLHIFLQFCVVFLFF
jgi:hypothetical protein